MTERARRPRTRPVGVVPFNDLARRWAPLAAEAAQITAEVVGSGRVILGPEVASFEAELASAVGVPHAVGVANGTDALELALRALEVKAGDRVVTVANAGGYASTAIGAVGAKPVYVEIEPATLSMSPEALEAIISVRRPSAVVLTHLYGRVAEVEEIVPICRRAGVALVEDCAQAHGAEVKGRPVGAWGDAAAFSFYPTKNLGALGDGGAVVSPRRAIVEAVRELRQYGWRERYRVARSGGRNSRLDELQAALLRLALPRLGAANSRRREIAARYLEAFRDCALGLPPDDLERSVWHLFVVRSHARDQLRRALVAEGIETAVHYPIADNRQYGSARGRGLPLTEAACAEVLSLPLFAELTEEEVERTVAVVRKLCQPARGAR